MIRKSIQALIAESHNKMLGYVAMQSYYYAQLCVKHEAASLLPLEIEYLGRTYKFEEVARAMYAEGEENDDKMYIYPNDMEYLKPLMEAIVKVHPEFKQELLTNEDENEDENSAMPLAEQQRGENENTFGTHPTDNDERSASPLAEQQQGKNDDDDENSKYYYILLTMPPVTKQQRKIYLDAVDGVYKYIVGKIDLERGKLNASITAKTAACSKEDADECKETADKIYEKDKAMADQQKEEKVKEIEEAYQRYLAQHPDEGVENDDDSDRQPSMPEDHSAPSEPEGPQAPKMPKAPEAPANPLEGFGIG